MIPAGFPTLSAYSLGTCAPLLLLFFGELLLSCQRRPPPDQEAQPVSSQSEPTAALQQTAPADPDAQRLAREYEAALTQLSQAREQPNLGGAPGMERQHAALVARAKSEPVVFIRTPEVSKGDAQLDALRETFETTDFVWKELSRIRRRYAVRPELHRKILLREGYLYAEHPGQAFALVSQVKPKELFREQRIWVHRGPWLMQAKRGKDGDYFYTDGPELGKKVRLLHLDRVGTGEPPAPLHRDFRGLRYRLFFDAARVTHFTENQLIAELRYGRHWVTSLLKSDGARLDLVAQAIPPEHAQEIAEARTLQERRLRVLAVLRDAMRQQIDEGLPFDEPKNEIGQQDGALRRPWRYAYLEGKTFFKFNDDRYPVFNENGDPLVPQVCIDFMVDTFQRASGSWWLPRSAKTRARTPGRLNLEEFGRDELRRTKGFLTFASEHPEWFDVRRFAETERVELGYKPLFFGWLEKNADQFQPGDMVFIRGMTPWDEEEEHTHSFFIYEADPLTGMPIAIAGNAGPANLWSWETEARRTPKRSVRVRVRPRLEWLESFITTDPTRELEPPALVSGKK